ncbi:MAG TPA: hypothetical protein ENJ95_11080 [Bacteroidetes bacterium]|nr:hypothetical protein [Bacteroidota bacterium]
MEANQILDVDFDSDPDKEDIELVGVNKFILLSILSLGLYGMWWMYKSWKFFKEKDLLDIMPAGRAIFAIFFTYSLFEKIQDYAKSNGYTKSYSSVGLFVMFILLNFMARLPPPFWLVSLFSFLFLIQPSNALNYAIKNSNDYNGIERKEFNTRQIVIVVIGGLFWLLMIAGLLMPPVGY